MTLLSKKAMSDSKKGLKHFYCRKLYRNYQNLTLINLEKQDNIFQIIDHMKVPRVML